MATIVYWLCALTSVACAVLLLRAYARHGPRLLLWSGFSFVGFAIGNALLVVDRVIVPTVDLSLIRSLPVLAGLLVLIYGLVWDTK